MVRARWILFAGLLAGCGGGGGSFIQGNSGSVAVTFVAGDGYNGVVDPLSSYTSLDGSAANGIAETTVTNDTRSLSVAAITSDLATGTVVDLAGTTGSSVTYIDPNGHWTATSGTLTIQSRTTTAVQIVLTNVVLTNSSNGALGTVTASGSVIFNATS